MTHEIKNDQDDKKDDFELEKEKELKKYCRCLDKQNLKEKDKKEKEYMLKCNHNANVGSFTIH